jgi:hypothetical protein
MRGEGEETERQKEKKQGRLRYCTASVVQSGILLVSVHSVLHSYAVGQGRKDRSLALSIYHRFIAGHYR